MFTYPLTFKAIAKRMKYATILVALSSMSFLHASETSDSLSYQEQIDQGKAISGTCAGCHGADGIATPGHPNLAGQVPGYIALQLAMFKSGERQNAIMAGQVAGLTEQDMADLDAYFSSLTPPKASVIINEADEDAVATATLGEKLYRSGNKEFEIPSCMSCHGPTAAGIPSQYPRLANQPAAYIESSLLEYKSGARQNSIMNMIAFKLSEEQITALATYIEAIQDNRSE